MFWKKHSLLEKNLNTENKTKQIFRNIKFIIYILTLNFLYLMFYSFFPHMNNNPSAINHMYGKLLI